ncbi:Mov34/MPN/PAD-1 family protein [Listeria innocua]|uniref:Mov34/MPN/PAD-1 family protein n=1 Tax=Listeria innocua TaxID=1642 RepID=UPI0005EDB146|nr:Mov34/MPN/PAD-1 family protein [Listeria innocua]EAE6208693.1 hypothetical protein [Listeria innocua]EDO1165323.1 hypothetical protein [Listeria innocua]EDO1170693.1 hypothetical protein [Listeria innocua]EEP3926946.1 hypothetical protein [Listeria innocua]EHF3610829.1 hypothetical protein [Listeria innocua]
MFHSEFELESNVLDSFIDYSQYPNEVGGALFGIRNKRTYKIMVISIKQGERFRITFDEQDTRLFFPPENLILLGTWHTHPFQKIPDPSIIDYYQWKRWRRDLIHIILGETVYSIYNRNGKKLTTEVLKGTE